MYLVDTNIFLESLLGQNRTNEVRLFLQSIDLSTIFITDLSLHSIGIILFRLQNFPLFLTFLEDIVINGVLSLTQEDHKTLGQHAQQFHLDFDDAYQYAVAKKYDLQLISFDTDFDQTDRGRQEPVDVL